MTYSDNHELSEQERAALAALPRELAPSDLLEERVVRALKNEGHFGAASPAQRSWRSAAMKIAAAIALFAGGVATGHYAMSQQPAASAAVRQASLEKPAPTVNGGAQSVKNNETVVAEREMWL